MDPALVHEIVVLLERAQKELSEPTSWDTLLGTGYQTIRQLFGRHERRSVQDAQRLALTKCQDKSKRTLLRVYACVDALYRNHEITRPAEVGGTLLAVFGKEVFPDIPERELRYAKGLLPWEVDKVAEQLAQLPEIASWLRAEPGAAEDRPRD
jgi:hypothetical protein